MLKEKIGVSEMTQCIKVLRYHTSLGDLRSVPRSHIKVEGKNLLPKLSSDFLISPTHFSERRVKAFLAEAGPAEPWRMTRKELGPVAVCLQDGSSQRFK